MSRLIKLERLTFEDVFMWSCFIVQNVLKFLFNALMYIKLPCFLVIDIGSMFPWREGIEWVSIDWMKNHSYMFYLLHS